MKLLIVDDHALIREALRGVLGQLIGEAVVLEAADWARSAKVLEDNPDIGLILLDLNLPDREGLAALAELRQRYPLVSIVVLSGQQDRGTVMKALELGALGFIPKSAEREVMINALRLVLSGGMYIPPQILAQPKGITADERARAEGAKRPPSPGELGLTDRQIEVLALIMQGKSNKAICRVLNLAEPTVKNHVSAIMKLLGVGNRTEAVIRVGSLGWKIPDVPAK
jgi:DNA-binding NarL/FixJ family response regulator